MTFNSTYSSRFAEFAYQDLRPWYKHCLKFAALKRRLIDDPPDPWDDHPSLMPAGEGSRDDAGATEGVEAVELGAASDASHVSFQGPNTRAFAYELRQELATVWDFYRAEVETCTADFARLQDDVASERHTLRAKAPMTATASSTSLNSAFDADDALGAAPTPQKAAAALSPEPWRSRRRPGNASSPAARHVAAADAIDDSLPLLTPVRAAGDSSGAADPYVQVQLKDAMVQLFERCERLVVFRMINHDACRRLVALHCTSRCGGDAIASLYLEKSLLVFLLAQPLFADRTLSGLTDSLELLYASVFSHGRADVARTALTLKAARSLLGDGSAGGFRRLAFGRRLGAAAVLLVWVGWDCLGDDALGTNVWHDPAFRIYRGLGNLVLLVWTWGANLWVWRRFGIDYRRCLSMGPVDPGIDQVVEVWKIGCDLSIAWLVSFLFFYKALRGVLVNPVIMPTQFAHTFPLLLLLYVAHRFFTPWRARRGLMVLLWSTVISPFGRVRFVEGYVGDVLTSIVRVLIDVAFAVLYFAAGVQGWLKSELDLEHDYASDSHFYNRVLVPFLTAAPLWYRFQQNLRRAHDTGDRWPHLGNALKYATAMSVSLFGTYRPGLHNSPTWIAAFVGATLYQFAWDVLMDWDLVRWEQGRLRLRSRLLYERKSFYVAVTCINFLLRFLWTVSIIPENRQNLFTEDFQIYLSPIIAAAEILRRSMWGFLRVENEHLSIYNSSGGSLESSASGELGGDALPTSGGAGPEYAGGGDYSPSLLSKVPFAKMEIGQGAGMSAASSSGGGKRRGLRAWCFGRVQPEQRRTLLLELCVFSATLIVIVLMAGWQT